MLDLLRETFPHMPLLVLDSNAISLNRGEDSLAKMLYHHPDNPNKPLQNKAYTEFQRLAELEYLIKHHKLLVPEKVATEVRTLSLKLKEELRIGLDRGRFSPFTAEKKAEVDLINQYIDSLKLLHQEMFSLDPAKHTAQFRYEQAFKIEKGSKTYQATMDKATTLLRQILKERNKSGHPETYAQIFATAYELGREYEVCILTSNFDFISLSKRFNDLPHIIDVSAKGGIAYDISWKGVENSFYLFDPYPAYRSRNPERSNHQPNTLIARPAAQTTYQPNQRQSQTVSAN